MLVARGGAPFRLRVALWWSFTWALGAGLGVALGGWLTLVGGAGAPGAAAIDPISDLVVLPSVAFVGVLVLELLVRIAVAALRGRTVAGSEQHDDEQGAEDDRVLG